ncbi:hypothetical protein EMPG_14723 [Blastomyces silverae]|uniref:Protein kinase domain-containing protein n=1 Tax=Blastomyces silverae TaxID=2060906 RepID=A0A0H1BFR7_9EURO|nr:hypothetical protein EMPG_14723 [Blastomyces silverae]
MAVVRKTTKHIPASWLFSKQSTRATSVGSNDNRLDNIEPHSAIEEHLTLLHYLQVHIYHEYLSRQRSASPSLHCNGGRGATSSLSTRRLPPGHLGRISETGKCIDRDKTYVAIKISVAERDRDAETRELQIMKQLSTLHHPCLKYVMRMLDDFSLKGPNGSHQCHVYELLRPNISDTITAHFPSGRLPGKVAKVIAKQCLIGLDGLHQRNIGHGDLHTRNLVFTIPDTTNLPEEKFIEMLGEPEVGRVQRRDGKELGPGVEPGVPEYIVRPSLYLMRLWNSTPTVKIVDFGESFLPTTVPQTLHTPLSVRAPEVIFQDCIDYQVDLWSMGCMVVTGREWQLFELFTGQPPFDTFMTTPTILVGQMREMASDNLPERWQGIWDVTKTQNGMAVEAAGPNLQEWLEEVHFDGSQNADLAKEDIAKLGEIIGRLLYFEPSARASAREVLDDPWFNE